MTEVFVEQPLALPESPNSFDFAFASPSVDNNIGILQTTQPFWKQKLHFQSHPFAKFTYLLTLHLIL